MEDLKIFDENGKALHIGVVMQRATEYYDWIDKMGEKLAKVCMNKVQPLLDECKFNEAKKEVDRFYKPSKLDDHIIFIERDMIMAKINRMKSKHSA
jgi:hypothetical protein